MAKQITATKAKEILKDGTVHGKPLTAKAKRYMGWVAGGRKKRSKKSTGRGGTRVATV
jgi:hypothetical protein